MSWTVERSSPGVVTVRVKVDKGCPSIRLLLRGDAHHDNPHSDRKIEKKHLDQAKESGAGIIDVGDLFCAMQGKYDKRADKSCVRPEHQEGNYLDRLVDTAADFYQPYADNFISIAVGNHEDQIRSRHETDLTERLCERLVRTDGSRVINGGYSGWVRILLQRGQQRRSVRLWYMHGYGGGGPVTLDTIQSQRQSAYIENADIMVTGHTHDAWAIDRVKMRCSDQGVIERRQFWAIKVPTYKDEYGTGTGGWHVATGKPPKPLGAWWATVSMEDQITGLPAIAVERAQ